MGGRRLQQPRLHLLLLLPMLLEIHALQLSSAFHASSGKYTHTHPHGSKWRCRGATARGMAMVDALLGLGPEMETARNSFATKNIGAPRVLRFTNKFGVDQWVMWFHGRDHEFDSDIVDLSTGRIGYATSRNGLEWNVKEGPGHKGCVMDLNTDWWTFDTAHLGLGDVLAGSTAESFDEDAGPYFMYYFGGTYEAVEMATSESRTAEPMKGMRMRIGLAVSKDGYHWSRVEGEHPTGAIVDVGAPGEFDSLFVGWPQVLAVGDEYKLYYHTYDEQKKRFCVGLAESTNGMKWRKVGEVFNGGPDWSFDGRGASRRHVLREAATGEYLMFYEGVGSAGHQIGLATSADGIKWQRSSEAPMLSPGAVGAWDEGGVGSPCLVKLPDGRYRMYYVGTSKPDSEGKLRMKVGLAESIDTSGRQWRKL